MSSFHGSSCWESPAWSTEPLVFDWSNCAFFSPIKRFRKVEVNLGLLCLLGSLIILMKLEPKHFLSLLGSSICQSVYLHSWICQFQIRKSLLGISKNALSKVILFSGSIRPTILRHKPHKFIIQGRHQLICSSWWWHKSKDDFAYHFFISSN